MKKVAIVMPAHNEAKRIGETLGNYLHYFSQLKSSDILDFEIIVVLNACIDNTREVVEQFMCDELIILKYKQGGKGFAVIEGFKDALTRDNDYIGFVDADNATPPNAFYGLVKHINGYDGVIADRWDKRSKVNYERNVMRQLMSRVFNSIVRILFLLNYRDTQCGAKLFSRDLIGKIYYKLGSSQWSFDVDLLFYARRENARIKSIPTEWYDKKGSHINMKKTPARMFFSVIRLRLVHSAFEFLARLHGKLPEKMKASYWFG